jgi:hypothetical protein
MMAAPPLAESITLRDAPGEKIDCGTSKQDGADEGPGAGSLHRDKDLLGVLRARERTPPFPR